MYATATSGSIAIIKFTPARGHSRTAKARLILRG